MNEKDKIKNLITSAIQEINQTLPADRQISTAADAALYEPGGLVDSLTLTLLIVAIEQKIEQTSGSSVALIDYSMGLGEHQAFSSIDSLSEHILLLISAKK